jgi:hypothetical protein
MKLKSGDTVRVIGERGTAKVRAILTSMNGALLEKAIDGFRRSLTFSSFFCLRHDSCQP